MSERALLEGSEAMARAAVAAGCRFFAGYPMTPFTELLEHMASLLPEVDGVCMNAESELEAVGMAWGAAVTGHLAATGSTGQGLSLMQESLSEITNARLPLVVFNMARGQGDYFQTTRGGGHGDYRHIVPSPHGRARSSGADQAGVRAGRAVAQPGGGVGRLLPGSHLPSGVGSLGGHTGTEGAQLGAQRFFRWLGSGQDHLSVGQRERGRGGVRPGGSLCRVRGSHPGHGRWRGTADRYRVLR